MLLLFLSACITRVKIPTNSDSVEIIENNLSTFSRFIFCYGPTDSSQAYTIRENPFGFQALTFTMELYTENPSKAIKV